MQHYPGKTALAFRCDQKDLAPVHRKAGLRRLDSGQLHRRPGHGPGNQADIHLPLLFPRHRKAPILQRDDRRFIGLVLAADNDLLAEGGLRQALARHVDARDAVAVVLPHYGDRLA